jgi:cytochrome oxidase Cu insertion factor (SCO1/SenC/PrrC family)
MNNSALPYWLALAVVLAGLYGGFKYYQVLQAEQQRYAGGVVAPHLPPLEDFELTDQHGEPFRSADMKGKVWVASFFFSTCPSNCARLNSNIKALTEMDDLRDVTWATITVDPETDTTERLADYAKQMNAVDQWHFCRHDEFSYVKRLAHDVFTIGGVTFKGHNDYVVVIDKHGKIAGMFNGYNMDELAQSIELIKKCLAEDVPAAETSADESPAVEKPAEAA